jgi:hypothetical protein
VGDRENLEIYLNSASKNTSETDIFPHGTKYLLTRVTVRTVISLGKVQQLVDTISSFK